MRNGIKMILSVLLLCFGMGARADNVVSIGTASGAPGDEVTVSIGLQNSDAVSSLQVSIPLDERFSFVDGSASLGSRGNGHSVTAGVKDGEINIMVYSLGLAALAGNEGEVVTFRLKLGNQPSDIALTVSKLIVGDTSGNTLSATAQSGSVSIRCAKAQYSTMTVDFGSVPIRSTYTRNFTVTNVGNEPLEVTGLAFQNVMTKYSTSTQFPLTVAAGGSASLNITYAPDERGTVSETVKVLCNSISKLNNISLTAEPFAVNELHVQPASGYSDETVTVALNMNNMDAISGFQFEFNLPEALEFVPNSFVLSGRKQDHVVVSTVANGLLRIIGYSPSDKSLTGEDGELGTMQFVLRGRNNVTLKPSKAVLSATINNKVENVCSADYGATITIRSPRLSANSSLNMGRTPVTGDAVSNFVVRNYGNAPLTISRVLFDKEGFYIRESLPLTIDASRNATLTVVYPSTEEGDYQTTMQIYSNDPEQRLWNVTVSGHRFAPNTLVFSAADIYPTQDLSVNVSMSNYDAINGLQFDVEYPSSYFEPTDELVTTQRAAGLSVSQRIVGTNVVRYFFYSLSGAEIASGEGEIFTFKLRTTSTPPVGNYTLKITNVKLGTSGMENKYSGSDLSCSFKVKNYLLGDVNGDGRVNEVDAQQILDVSAGLLSLTDLVVPEAIHVPGGNPDAFEINAQIVLYMNEDGTIPGQDPEPEAEFSSQKYYTIRCFHNTNAYVYQNGNQMGTGSVNTSKMFWWVLIPTTNENCYYIMNATTGKYVQSVKNLSSSVTMGDTPVEFEVKRDEKDGSTKGYYYIASTDQAISTESSSTTLGLNWSQYSSSVVVYYIRSGTNRNSYWDIVEDEYRYNQ